MEAKKIKGTIPEMKPGVLQRPRIDGLLREAMEKSLVTITAGAGYGKTQAVLSFMRRQEAKVIWIALTELDNYLYHFWNSFVQGVAAIDEKLAAALSEVGFPNSLTTFHDFLILFTKSLYREQKVYLVMDDYHHMKEKTVVDFIGNLIMSNLENMTVCLISRTHYPANYASYFYKSSAVAIERRQLAFTLEETTYYFRQLDADMDEKVILRLHTKAEGWPFAISLLGQRIKNGSYMEADLISHATPLIFDMIEKEIFSKYSPNVQRILIKLSVLEKASQELILEMAGDDLEALKHSTETNMFIYYNPHTQTYRFHQIFRNYLIQKQALLSQEDLRQHLRDLAVWCKERGQSMEALDCYRVCGDYDEMWNIIYGFYSSRFTVRLAVYLIDLIKEFPAEYRKKYPMLRVVEGCMHISILQIERACELLREFIEEMKEKELNEEERQAVSFAYINLAFFTMMQSKQEFGIYFKEAARLAPEGCRHISHRDFIVENDFVFTLSTGRPGELEEYLQKTREIIPYTDKVMNGCGYGREHLVFAEASYLVGDIKKAVEYAYQCIYKAMEREQTDIVCSGYFNLVRIAVYRGNYDEVMKNLRLLRQYADEHYHDNHFNLPDMAEAWFYTKIGYPDMVSDWISNRGFYESMQIPLIRGRERVLTAVSHLLNGRSDKCLEILEDNEEIFTTRSQFIPLTNNYMIKSFCYRRMGEYEKMAAAMRKVYEMTHANRLIVLPAEGGKVIMETIALVRNVPGHGIPEEWLNLVYARASTYAKRVAFIQEKYNSDHQIVSGSTVELNPRERSILQLLCRGFTREEIADEFGLSINSLKYTLKNIYSKLGAINSNDAVRIAIIRGVVNL